MATRIELRATADQPAREVLVQQDYNAVAVSRWTGRCRRARALLRRFADGVESHDVQSDSFGLLEERMFAASSWRRAGSKWRSGESCMRGSFPSLGTRIPTPS